MPYSQQEPTNSTEELQDLLDEADSSLCRLLNHSAAERHGIRWKEVQKLRDRIQAIGARLHNMNDPAVEALATYAHETWSSDVERIFLLSDRNEDGSVTIDADHARRWGRKMITAYVDLSEAEKQAERFKARKMLEIMSSIYQDGAKSAVGEDEGVRKYKVADAGRMVHLEPGD